MNPVSLYTSKVSGETGPGTGMAAKLSGIETLKCFPEVFIIHLGVVGTGSRRAENMAGTAHD